MEEDEEEEKAKPPLGGLPTKKLFLLPLSSAGSVPQASPRAGGEISLFFVILLLAGSPLSPVWVMTRFSKRQISSR
jgi:hypothetical protein